MYHYKVGDVVQRLSQFQNALGWPHGDKRMTVTGITANYHLMFEDDFSGGWMPERFNLVQVFSPIPRMEDHKAAHRANDRDTAVAAAASVKVSQKEQAVLDYIKLYAFVGSTGKEIANFTGLPLNTVTPRFAPLQRKGLIKDSGMRRDRQIAWVVA